VEAKLELHHYRKLPWVCIGAVAAFLARDLARDLAKELLETLAQYQDHRCRSMKANLIGKWVENLVTISGGDLDGVEMMKKLLNVSSESGIEAKRFKSEIEGLIGPEYSDILSETLENSESCRAIQDVLLLSLLKVVFGLSYTGLELNMNYLDPFTFPDSFRALIPTLLDVIQAYDAPTTTRRTFSICCSVVQNGGYFLMPRVIAEELISDLDSSIFVMIPGWLAKDDVPVVGFITKIVFRILVYIRPLIWRIWRI